MLKELLLCMLWMYIRDDLFSFLPFFFLLSVLVKKKKLYETTESMLMYHVLFLAWKYKIQRNSVLKLPIPSFAMSGCCRGWAQGMTPVPCGHSKAALHQADPAPCIPVPQKAHEPKDIFVCFNRFCMFLWIRRWGVVETNLFDHFLQFW